MTKWGAFNGLRIRQNRTRRMIRELWMAGAVMAKHHVEDRWTKKSDKYICAQSSSSLKYRQTQGHMNVQIDSILS